MSSNSRTGAVQRWAGPPTIDVQVASCVASVPDEHEVAKWVAATLAAVRHRNAVELAVRFVDEEEGQALNHRFRDRDYATNVLSFANDPGFADVPEDCAQPLGDIVLCAPIVEREATEQHKNVADHWAHLIVHGTLHLLGHDHEETADRVAMESIEVAVLQSQGIGDPYAAG